MYPKSHISSTSLDELSFNDNDFTGSINISCLTKFTNLRKSHAGENKFSGPYDLTALPTTVNTLRFNMPEGNLTP